MINNYFSYSLFTCTDEQSTDEDTSDENAQILDEMSQTLENLLRENTVEFLFIINENLFFDL